MLDELPLSPAVTGFHETHPHTASPSCTKSISILLNSPWDKSQAAHAMLPTIQSMKHALILFTLRTVPVRHTRVTVHVNTSRISTFSVPYPSYPRSLSHRPMFFVSHAKSRPKWPLSAVLR